MRLRLGPEEKGGQPPTVGFVWGIWTPPNERGSYGGSMPRGPKLGFTLAAVMKDESCDVMLGIPKEKGLETKGID